MSEPRTLRHPVLVVAVLVAMVAALVTTGVVAHRAAGPGSPTALPTAAPAPAPSGTATPAPTAAPVGFADCSKATFGSALGPLDPPSDIHVYSAAPPMTIDTGKLYRATMTTNRGPVVLCLQPSLAPATVNVFVTLARNHFFDGLKIPRSDAAVIQAGSPTNDQTGGPGFSFKDEPVRNKYVAGCVAMANAGANTNGSQFFICKVDDSTAFPPSYNLFGKVQSGLAVVNAIAVNDTIQSITVAQQT